MSVVSGQGSRVKGQGLRSRVNVEGQGQGLRVTFRVTFWVTGYGFRVYGQWSTVNGQRFTFYG